MPPLSPLQYRWSLVKKALFGDHEIIYEVLVHHKNNLPAKNVEVSWQRDGEYIVGTIMTGGETYMTQARSAQEFVEMVNDALYAAYEVPQEYAQQLGGYYRLMPSADEFNRLNNVAIKKSSLNFDRTAIAA